jgi:energy-coupling factor transport system permease protein
MIKYSFYRSGDTWLHRLDPRVKLLLSMLWTLLFMVTFNGPGGLFLLLLLVLGIVGTIGLDLEPLIGLMKLVVPFAVLAIFFFIGFAPLWYNPENGHGLFKVRIGRWEYALLWEVVAYGLSSAIRIIAVVVVSTVPVLMATSPRDLLNGLNRMGLPYTVALTMALALRLFPVFVGDFQTIRDAQRSRGLELDTAGFLTRARRLTAIAVPLIILATNRAEQLELSLTARAFGALPPAQRTALRAYHVGWGDALSVAITVLILALAYGLAQYGILA